MIRLQNDECVYKSLKLHVKILDRSLYIYSIDVDYKFHAGLYIYIIASYN